jgi:acyl carrier protein
MAAIPDLEARVKQILTNRLGIAPDEIRLDASLVEDLGMDSLDAVELAIATERQFNIGLSDEQVAKLKTVADIVTLVRRLAHEPDRGPAPDGRKRRPG